MNQLKSFGSFNKQVKFYLDVDLSSRNSARIGKYDYDGPHLHIFSIAKNNSKLAELNSCEFREQLVQQLILQQVEDIKQNQLKEQTINSSVMEGKENLHTSKYEFSSPNRAEPNSVAPEEGKNKEANQASRSRKQSEEVAQHSGSEMLILLHPGFIFNVASSWQCSLKQLFEAHAREAVRRLHEALEVQQLMTHTYKPKSQKEMMTPSDKEGKMLKDLLSLYNGKLSVKKNDKPNILLPDILQKSSLLFTQVH